jgi:nucleoside-diphosphate-sugar epimerase
VRVLVAGATGVLGRQVVPRLLTSGHEVAAMTRHEDRAAAIRAQGAEALVADVWDADGLRAALVEAPPDAVVDLLTDIPQEVNPRKYADAMAGNDRMRREGTPRLVAAAATAGARRYVAQTVAFLYAPAPGLACERDPLWHDAPGSFAGTVAAVQAAERAVLGADGIHGVVLRLGWLYGPGTHYAADGPLAALTRKRRYPVIGGGGGVNSFLHAGDAADALVLALDHGDRAVYNVVDDEPAPVYAWLPAYAEELGADPPRRVPEWLARLVAGPMITAAAVHTRGADNTKAKRELGWLPARPTWRGRLSTTA